MRVQFPTFPAIQALLYFRFEVLASTACSGKYIANVVECKDNAQWAEHCAQWAVDGKCSLNRLLMATYCARTCNLCSQQQQPYTATTADSDSGIMSTTTSTEHDDTRDGINTITLNNQTLAGNSRQSPAVPVTTQSSAVDSTSAVTSSSNTENNSTKSIGSVSSLSSVDADSMTLAATSISAEISDVSLSTRSSNFNISAAIGQKTPSSSSSSALLSLLMTSAGASQPNVTSRSLTYNVTQPARTKSSLYTAAAPTSSTFVRQATTYSSSVASQPYVSYRQSTEATHSSSSSSSGSNGGRRRTISDRAVAAVKMTSTAHSRHRTALTKTSILHDLHALPTTQLHHSADTATLTSPDVITLRDTTVTSVASVTHDDFNSTAARAHDDAAASVKNHLPSSSVTSTQPHDVKVTSQTDVTSNATESVSREGFVTSSSRDVDVVTSHSSISDTDTVELVSVEMKSDVDIDRSQTKPALKPDTSTRSSRPLSSRYTSSVSRLWRSVSSRLQLSTMNITTISSNTSSNTNAVELASTQTPGDKMSSRKSSTSITVASARADNFNFSSGFSLTQTSTTLQSTSDSERQGATDHLTKFTGVDDVFSNSSNQSDTTRTLEHLSLSQQTTKPHQFLTGFYDQALSQSAVRESSDKTVVAKFMSSPNTRLSERWSTVRVTDRVKSSISSRLMDALTQVVSYSSPFSTSANSSSFDSMTAASTCVPITSTLSNSKSSISADSSTTAVWTRRPMSTMAASLSNVSSLSTRFAAKNNKNINVTSNSVVDFSSSPSVSASHKNAEDVTLSLQTTFAKLSTVFLSADSSRPSSVRDHTSSAAAFTQPTSHREDNDSHTSVSHFTPLLSASTSLHSSRYSTTQQQHQRSPLTLTNVHNVTYFSHHHRTASSTIVTPNLPVNISGGAYDTPRYAATLLSTETRY